MLKLYFSSLFNRELKKLVKKNPNNKKIIFQKLSKLARNPNDPSLRLHKLSGKNNWSITIAKDTRVLFGFKNNKIYLLRIGKHDNVY